MRPPCHRQVMTPEATDRYVAETRDLDLRLYTVVDGLTVGHCRLTYDLEDLLFENVAVLRILGFWRRRFGVKGTWVWAGHGGKFRPDMLFELVPGLIWPAIPSTHADVLDDAWRRRLGRMRYFS